MPNKNNPWWVNAIIYEVYVDKFAGNFAGLTEKLNYLKFLGIDTLWILPHYPSPMIDGGYDVADYTSVRGELGEMKDFEEFVKEAHENNIRVILDLVLNHTSSDHPWFIEARGSKNNSKRDWYMWSSDATQFSQAFIHFSDVKNS